MECCFSFQAPFNRLTYRAIGDDSAPAYFSVSEENGEIRVRSSLAADTATSYTVCDTLCTQGIFDDSHCGRRSYLCLRDFDFCK